MSDNSKERDQVLLKMLKTPRRRDDGQNKGDGKKPVKIVNTEEKPQKPAISPRS